MGRDIRVAQEAESYFCLFGWEVRYGIEHLEEGLCRYYLKCIKEWPNRERIADIYNILNKS